MKKFDFRNKAEGRYGYGDNVTFIKITMSNQYSENIKDRKEMLTKLNKEIDELRKQDTKVNRSNYSNIKEYMEDVTKCIRNENRLKDLESLVKHVKHDIDKDVTLSKDDKELFIKHIKGRDIDKEIKFYYRDSDLEDYYICTKHAVKKLPIHCREVRHDYGDATITTLPRYSLFYKEVMKHILNGDDEFKIDLPHTSFRLRVVEINPFAIIVKSF